MYFYNWKISTNFLLNMYLKVPFLKFTKFIDLGLIMIRKKGLNSSKNKQTKLSLSLMCNAHCACE